MKKYKINRAYAVNTKASKNGVKWEYGGKKTWGEAVELKEGFEKTIDKRKEDRKAGYCVQIGLRITDTETNTVIYERLV